MGYWQAGACKATVPKLEFGNQPNLNQPHTVAHITTEGITTLHKFSLVPALNQGQTELYTVAKLTGTAQFVLF